ncbi:unnamed protein product [Amoebophrya sp. A120]|nr:unnamed protein product [Amoebophrya sp. A120]|eukprot:GSA120T00012515001.1
MPTSLVPRFSRLLHAVSCLFLLLATSIPSSDAQTLTSIAPRAACNADVQCSGTQGRVYLIFACRIPSGPPRGIAILQCVTQYSKIATCKKEKESPHLGKGKCGPVGGGDLCICNPFWEGNNCNQQIRNIDIEYEAGVMSGGLAGIVIGSLIIIPLSTGILLYAMHIKDCFDD